ncbi:hypothetical protein EDD16DRAFT_1724299 [Pisolithus croceorrhizus]|nr:hypothetical protein EDD16DRAFT_1724299 [Pisolithus croceorrhizus]
MLWLGAIQGPGPDRINATVVSCFKNTIGYFHYQIRTTSPHPLPRLSAASLSEFVDNFPLHKLPKRHGHPGRVRFCPHRGFNFCHVIWHNDTSGTYVYYMHFSEDAATLKFLVAVIWVLDTLHVSFSKCSMRRGDCMANPRLVCHALYYYLITNYGVIASLEYMVWSFRVSALVNLLVILVVQSFFAHKIHYFCRPQVRWLLTTPIILFMFAHFGFGMGVAVLTFVDNKMSMLTRTWVVALREKLYYGVTPSAATGALADILIAVSLCVHLYGSGSLSAAPRTKRLVSTLIVYVVNRCLMTSLVVIAQLTVVRVTHCKMVMSLSYLFQNVDQLPAWTMGLDFIIGKPSLNTRQYLQSQGSDTVSSPNTSAIHFADMLKPSRDTESCKDGRRRLDMHKVTVIEITDVNAVIGRSFTQHPQIQPFRSSGNAAPFIENRHGEPSNWAGGEYGSGSCCTANQQSQAHPLSARLTVRRR